MILYILLLVLSKTESEQNHDEPVVLFYIRVRIVNANGGITVSRCEQWKTIGARFTKQTKGLYFLSKAASTDKRLPSQDMLMLMLMPWWESAQWES